MKAVVLYIQIRHYEGRRGIHLGQTKEDERKNPVNQQKHGGSFETAILIFDDPYHLTRQDREVEGEPRWQTIGMMKGVHVLLVAHTVSEDEEVIRIF